MINLLVPYLLCNNDNYRMLSYIFKMQRYNFFLYFKKKLYLCKRFDSENIPQTTENQERCRSGRSGRSRKPLTSLLVPGFESLPLRKKIIVFFDRIRGQGRIKNSQ